ncbi:unnamed protein product [Zymoseptoria tritici ST99CH_3D1]|uniref:HTH APSES-type domain-containing protein n=2 Tax=Zymoseptoria tritici TaxID=1047171 RepID=A0A1X7RWL0_ZYMT9|nr:unnamed protein product [Zymoseptoria tritici ST99CH_3D7]SMR53855.1 unnamed protein product [Zymoseptoria tritici ST99CH_1E4]SMR56109.1 unnamed protein product [Zymoseptoria tritici ST99CH_3D1]
MNQQQPYMDGHAPASAPPPGMPQYPNYGHPQPMQPGSHSYPPQSYPQYSYSTMPPMSAGHPVTSSMGQQMVPQSLPLPTMSAQPQPPAGANQQYPSSFDQTGQVAPHGMKPRVTATLWEDEGSLCFQVEANGVCVARREDNHMINGTKLLNVAGMTRGRRDGILKSEKTRHVVKIGPMHLKGVWIPFDRALDFANKEKITELLYPLFVHNIGALLYHPSNAARQSVGGAAMASAARRSDQQDYMRTPQGSQPPTLTHHHSMSTPGGGSMPQPPHSIAPHPASGRPGLDRAHTFPTPPTSASSLNMNMGHQGSSYGYGEQNGAIQSAATPPNHAQGIQYQTSQAPYDSQRQMYAPAPGAYGQQYAQQPSMNRYGQMQTSPDGVKSEMGPPARAGAENENAEAKPHGGYGGQHDVEGEHEGEYTHSRPVHTDPSHISPEMTHSPHQNGSGRATPRTTTTYAGYNTTTQRPTQLPQSNLNYVMSNDTRAGAPNGADTGYQPAYQASQYAAMNGTPVANNKRMREDESEDPYGRPPSANGDHKRQRTDSVSTRPIAQPQSLKAGGMRR